MPTSFLLGQRLVSPARHSGQVPSEVSGFTPTTRPRRSPLTPSPTSVTVPANSWPITSGGGRLPIRPREPSISEPQIPVAVGRTTTVPGSTVGCGTSSTDICSGPCHTIPFMLPPLHSERRRPIILRRAAPRRRSRGQRRVAQRGTSATARTGEPEPPRIFNGNATNRQNGGKGPKFFRVSTTHHPLPSNPEYAGL